GWAELAMVGAAAPDNNRDRGFCGPSVGLQNARPEIGNRDPALHRLPQHHRRQLCPRNAMKATVHPSVALMLQNPRTRAAIVKALASRGRSGDTMLAHINPAEAALLKRAGGVGTVNPRTGLRQFYAAGTGGGPYGGPGGGGNEPGSDSGG